MSGTRFCPICQMNVETELKVDLLILVFLLILGIAAGIFYLVYCYCDSDHWVCPYCGNKGPGLKPPRFGP